MFNGKFRISDLDTKLSREEMKAINGGKACETKVWSGSNGSGSEMTCDYMVYDNMGNFVRYDCETTCRQGCNYSGCSYMSC